MWWPRESPRAAAPLPSAQPAQTAPTSGQPAPGTNSTGEALSVSKIRRIWAPCQMFSLSDPCPDASKTLWEIPPPPSTPALITGEECEAQSAAPAASVRPAGALGERRVLGGKGGQKEGPQGGRAMAGCPWMFPSAGRGAGEARPPRPALAAVPEQQDMSNIHPTGGVRSKALK